MKTYGHSDSFPYVYDFGLFIVPRGKPYSSLEKLFFPFKMEVWICASLVFLVMVVAIFILKFMAKEKHDFVIGPSNAPLLNLFSIVVGGSTTTFQVPQKNFARTILAILLLTTLILRNAYLGNLFNFLRTQKRMKQLNYVQDVAESDVAIYSLRDIRLYSEIAAIGDRMKNSTRKLEDIRDAISDDNLDGVYTALKSVVEYNDLVNFQKPKLLTAKEYILMYHIVMRLRKFLKPSIDRQIVALLSSGLVQHWQKSYTKTVKNVADKHPKQLNIDEFTGIIAICAAMYALSILVFIKETDLSIKGTIRNYVTPTERMAKFVKWRI
ncbi:uncharacterized protein LOC119080945 [Bradysia coprophila]|uniref:uncharacterized protein LOC119080945 n=1 Tax=Bradysia coprophila TaxID=38358 RepID=UPI00187DB01E|nr:uncharacterized protein LOC119080945 [Bradysia coprophila]